MPFIGRTEKLKSFRRLLGKRTSSLVVCQGRKRVGKSTFIAQCGAEVSTFLSLEGITPGKGVTMQDQLDAFSADLARQTDFPKLKLDSWSQAFEMLSAVIKDDDWTVVVLDEISWMGIGDKDFAGYLKIAWDRSFSKHPKLVMFLCGSGSSWIQTYLLNSTGFVGRFSHYFSLDPLPLKECNEFWKGHSLLTRDKLKLLAVTGCIPGHVKEFDPNQPVDHEIQRMCFKENGLLFREFDQLFHELFQRRAQFCERIVRVLIDGPKTNTEIARSLNRARGGSLTDILEELELTGLIRKDHPFDPKTGKTSKGQAHYRLRDPYIRFYLKTIEPEKQAIEKGAYKNIPLENMPDWEAFMDLQFECLVLENLLSILRWSRLKNVKILNLGPYFQNTTARQKACQIDALVRTTSAVYVFEIKSRKSISTQVVDETKEKISRLKIPKDISVRSGLIYSGTLEPGIEKSDFFDLLISVDDFLESA